MGSHLRVMAIEAVAGGEAKFVVSDGSPARRVFTSTSEVVEAVVLGAFLTGAELELETQGGTAVVKRVLPIAPGSPSPGYPIGGYSLRRIATQRDPNGSDHLEVFVTTGVGSQETAYNVFDSLLQQLFVAVFHRLQVPTELGIALKLLLDGDRLVGVRLGEP